MTHYKTSSIFLPALLAIATYAVRLSSASCENTVNETCSFNKPQGTVMPQIDEYGVYISRKSECTLIRRLAQTYPIQTAGNSSSGVTKLPHTHNTLKNIPYDAKGAQIFNVACPPGQLAYFKLLSMQLEPQTCSDYVVLRDSTKQVLKVLCECNTTASMEPIIGDIKELFFRSDNENSAGSIGFTGFLQCFNPTDHNTHMCTKGSDDVLGRMMGRAKRQVTSVLEYLPQGEAKTSLASLSEAMFQVVARGVNRQTGSQHTNNSYFSDEDIKTALCHVRSCNAILRATARNIIHYSNQHQPGRVDVVYRAKNPPTPSPTPQNDQCVAIADNLPMCSHIPYSNASFPNLRGQGLEEARTELTDFAPILSCSNAITHFLCSVYAPYCFEDAGVIKKFHPCVSLCEYVKNDCQEEIESFGLGWPEHLNCNNDEIFKHANDNSSMLYCPSHPELLPAPTNTTSGGNNVTNNNNSNNNTAHGQCERITSIPACSRIGFGYSYALFPNQRHRNVFEANQHLASLQPLISTQCSELLQHLLCSVNAPFCYERQGRAHALTPCVEMCQFVKTSCEPILQQFHIQWPAELNCSDSNTFQPNNSLAYCPSHLKPNPDPSPVVNDREKEYTCSTMTDIPMCAAMKNLGWSNISFPNFRNHETQALAQTELNSYQPLLDTSTPCSNALVYFLCSVYAPYCDNDFPQLRLRPCKELCQHVKNDCEDDIQALGYRWPNYFDCDNTYLFPSRSELSFCPDDIEGLSSSPSST